ncbi:UDP-N-acetylmuramoyl-L-alanyl-D-glutamate--2,6-diaminopimelate ligase [Irregularibacter muris]|uniref:UDP-N-acetylmuramoyl-L-alanyl-D-glutamate--2, 6-diaminopimelate ligase n=1 Tax=Irregularibacter muris TaxID=1796619 RepID=A0AAE3HIM8_9FIRM|nr:UDP-N-acetylmuramoyl-L-alanyl-D-glutamate--2,6-diaminopimelate ligase [Irregularibacter muris]MCR1899303.1 UDP-N-acetylmuramoyl-L-alanyl-D-glutamate--2,6-diaminopimelate ligase [Irregularibacter muris]
MKLYKLLESIQVIKSWNEKDMDIHEIAYHSKKVNTGDLFVCIKGYQTDGHQYILQAIANGAVAIIVEEYQEGWNIPQFQVKDSRQALAALSDFYYNHPSQKMKMIGITATNGKTSTSFMTNVILESCGLKTGLVGTVMVKFGDYMEPSVLTTPESLDLHHYFAQMRDENVTHTVMEVSSSALELNRVGNVDFDIVTLNNISREHIDLHGSFEEYFHIKSSLIRNAKAHQWAILNLDCPYSASLVDKTEAQVLTFGVENKEGHLCCTDLDLSTGRAQFTVEIRKPFTVGDIEYKPKKFKIRLAVPGYHSVYNSMVAIAIGLLNGIPIPNMRRALSTFKGVERRFQFIFDEDIKIIDDHFANTGNIDVTLETLNFMDYNKLNLVYALRGKRGVTTNRENAEAIVNWADKLGIKEVIATLSQSHVSEKDKVTKEELAIFQETMKKAGITVHLYEELPEAINYSLAHVSPGDVVLLAGCQGMDCGAQLALEQLYKNRPDLDRDLLFEPLENRVAGIV